MDQSITRDISTRLEKIESQLDLSQKVITQIAQYLATLEPRLHGTLQHHAHQVKETVNLVSRSQRRTRMPIRCVFLLHHIAVWDALVGVYEMMAASEDFEPIVITLPHCFNKTRKFVGEEEVHHALVDAKTPHLRFGMENSYEGLDILKALEPDLIFRQSPYDADIPPAFATSEINFARLCYVSYGYQTIQKDVSENYFIVDQNFHRSCWRFFSLSEQHHAFVADNSLLNGRNAVITGFPKFDRLVEAGRERPYWPIQQAFRGYRVIWGAHHSVNPDWDGFGMFPRIYRDILEYARLNPGVEIAFKPHPMLFESSAHGLMTPEELGRFRSDWTALPNTAFLDGGDYGPLFAASDMMITDGVSFFSEYQLFDKPLVYLDSEHHAEFNPAGKILLKGMYRVTGAHDALDCINRFKAGGIDTLKTAREEVLKEIRPFPGQSVQKILQAIRHGLIEEGRLVL